MKRIEGNGGDFTLGLFEGKYHIDIYILIDIVIVACVQLDVVTIV